MTTGEKKGTTDGNKSRTRRKMTNSINMITRNIESMSLNSPFACNARPLTLRTPLADECNPCIWVMRYGDKFVHW